MIRGIKFNKYITTEYVVLNIYILEYYNADDRSIEALFYRQAYIVEGLKTKILVDINIITSENINLIIFERTDYIDSCYITFELSISSSRSFIRRDILLKKLISVLAYSYMIISIKYIDLLSEDNFIFKSFNKCLVALFASIVDLFFYIVLARNDIDELVQLSSKI